MLQPQQLEKLQKEIKKVVKENNLDGIVVADVEGLPIVSYLAEDDMDEDTLAAAGAAIFTASLMTVADAKKKGLEQVIIQSPDGYIIYTQLTDDLVLGVIAPTDSKLGILRMVIKSLQRFVNNL